VKAIARKDAWPEMGRVAGQYLKKDAPDFRKNVDAVRSAMLHDPADKFFKTYWANNDDESNRAVISVNSRTGQVRVFIGQEQP
jgi:hypothetical protein